MQKTNFEYEIIIHDDASTDNTINIIKEYAKKYPNIIYPIFEEKNQYSQNIDVLPLTFKHARGKYIAFCEGDDYWIDENKIQKQFDFMEKHKECSLITTNIKKYNDIEKKYVNCKSISKKSRFFSTEEIILGDGDLFSTNTMFFKTNLVKELPSFYYKTPIGDYPLSIHLALKGKVYYLNEVMGVYRVNAQGSWSKTMTKGDIEKNLFKLYYSIQNMFDEINKETNFKYKETIDYFLLKKEFNILFSLNKSKELKQNKFKKLYQTGSFISKAKCFIKIKVPLIFYFLKK